MKIVISVMVITALVFPISISAEDLLPSEKLLQNLLKANPDIDSEQQIFLAWRGFDIESKDSFDLVLLNRVGKTLIITDSEVLTKIMKRKEKRNWNLNTIKTGETVLEFDKPEGNLETALGERFGIRIVSKSTIFEGSTTS